MLNNLRGIFSLIFYNLTIRRGKTEDWIKKIGQDCLDMQCNGAAVVGGDAYPDAAEAAAAAEG